MGVLKVHFLSVFSRIVLHRLLDKVEGVRVGLDWKIGTKHKLFRPAFTDEPFYLLNIPGFISGVCPGIKNTAHVGEEVVVPFKDLDHLLKKLFSQMADDNII